VHYMWKLFTVLLEALRIYDCSSNNCCLYVLVQVCVLDGSALTVACAKCAGNPKRILRLCYARNVTRRTIHSVSVRLLLQYPKLVGSVK